MNDTFTTCWNNIGEKLDIILIQYIISLVYGAPRV